METITPPASGRPLAVFDLDGTLLRGDSLLPFLVRYGRRARKWRALGGLGIDLLAYALRLRSDSATKARVIRRFFAQTPLPGLEAHVRHWCEHWLPTQLHPAGVQRLREHQRQGDRVILLSASPSLYVPAIGRALGIAEVLCTQAEVVGGMVTGALASANCKGEEKLQRLRAHLGVADAPAGSHAYGDHHSDLPVLRWVHHGFLLRRGTFVRVERAAVACCRSA
jgi:phosphatidylglycerophosphatase C